MLRSRQGPDGRAARHYELSPFGRTHPWPAALKPFPHLLRRGEVNRTMKLITSTLAHARRDDGQTMAEYGVVLAVITLLVVAALTTLSGGISAALNAVTGIL